MAAAQQQAVYAYLVKEENRLEQELETARADVQKWVKRSKLAFKKGKLELGREAKERAIQAKQVFDSTQQELTTIKLKKADLRRRNAFTDESETIIQAEVLVEQFRMMGISPEESEANEIAGRMQAELDLAEVKDRTDQE